MQGKHSQCAEGPSVGCGSSGTGDSGERCEFCFLVIVAALNQQVIKSSAFLLLLLLLMGDRVQMLWTVWKFFPRSSWDPALHSH